MLKKYGEFVTNGPTDFNISEINGISIPTDYIEFMKQYNGGEGDIGNAWVVLDEKNELIEFNEDVDYDERFKNVILIGSDGGGEYFGIDKEGNYFVTPAIGDAEDTVILGKTLLEFLEGLNNFFNDEE